MAGSGRSPLLQAVSAYTRRARQRLVAVPLRGRSLLVLARDRRAPELEALAIGQ